ncbi:MAG: hypothetical protein ACI4OR_00515 [Alphaproteobacteria bacterium]
MFWVFCLCGMSTGALAADLLADEQGPTATEAVATITANEDFLLPSYVAPDENTSPQTMDAPGTTTAPIPSEVDILNEIFGTEAPAVATAQPTPVSRTFSPRTGLKRADETPLLTPLPPLPIIQNDVLIEAPQNPFKPLGYADQALAMATAPASGVMMPREIRLTFYPGQAAFSAQALKWAKSFALRVVNNPTLLAEIRVSEQNWPVQEKRLAVLLQILKETGVSAHQVRLYKTGREENTLLMGYVNNPDLTPVGNGKMSGERIQKTIDW